MECVDRLSHLYTLVENVWAVSVVFWHSFTLPWVAALQSDAHLAGVWYLGRETNTEGCFLHFLRRVSQHNAKKGDERGILVDDRKLADVIHDLAIQLGAGSFKAVQREKHIFMVLLYAGKLQAIMSAQTLASVLTRIENTCGFCLQDKAPTAAQPVHWMIQVLVGAALEFCKSDDNFRAEDLDPILAGICWSGEGAECRRAQLLQLCAALDIDSPVVLPGSDSPRYDAVVKEFGKQLSSEALSELCSLKVNQINVNSIRWDGQSTTAS